MISDGRPDNSQAALAAARALKPAVISAFYVGPPGDRTALGFMKALALMGGYGGVAGQRHLAAPLVAELVLLLAGPAR